MIRVSGIGRRPNAPARTPPKRIVEEGVDIELAAARSPLFRDIGGKVFEPEGFRGSSWESRANRGNLSLKSLSYMMVANPQFFMFDAQLMALALDFALAMAGNSNAARMAMMAMTTSSSIRVKALPQPFRPGKAFARDGDLLIRAGPSIDCANSSPFRQVCQPKYLIPKDPIGSTSIPFGSVSGVGAVATPDGFEPLGGAGLTRVVEACCSACCSIGFP